MIFLEAFAAISGLISVYFLTKQNIWCWPTGLASVAAAAIVFYDSFLYSDMILHVYYIGMNVYGWIHWLRPGKDRAELPVAVMRPAQNVLWAIVTLLLVMAWGWSMSHLDVIAGWVLVNIDGSIGWAQSWSQGNAPIPAYPYGDAFTTVASLIAMWFMARKLLENWGVLVHHRYSRHFDLHPEGLISFRWTVHNFSRPVRHGISGVEGVHEQK